LKTAYQDYLDIGRESNETSEVPVVEIPLDK
jgi:hypothetical protein